MDLSKKNKISLVLVGILLVFCSSVFREVIQTQDWLVNHQVNHFDRDYFDKDNFIAYPRWGEKKMKANDYSLKQSTE